MGEKRGNIMCRKGRKQGGEEGEKRRGRRGNMKGGGARRGSGMKDREGE